MTIGFHAGGTACTAWKGQRTGSKTRFQKWNLTALTLGIIYIGISFLICKIGILFGLSGGNETVGRASIK